MKTANELLLQAAEAVEDFNGEFYDRHPTSDFVPWTLVFDGQTGSNSLAMIWHDDDGRKVYGDGEYEPLKYFLKRAAMELLMLLSPVSRTLDDEEEVLG
jgi:hypothetical protein